MEGLSLGSDCPPERTMAQWLGAREVSAREKDTLCEADPG